MRAFLRRMGVVFSAGALGGIVNNFVVGYFGTIGITAALGIKVASLLSPNWGLYPRVVWGGIWGMLFLLPLLKGSVLLRGFLFGLVPSILQIFALFPFQAHPGMWALKLGLLTPLFVIVFNAVWGIAAALWLRGVNE